MGINNLCLNCMKDIGEETRCPYCGFNSNSSQLPPYLPLKTVLGRRYIVGKMLDYDGEGANYIAWDQVKQIPVYIRELLPDSFSTRTSANLSLQVMLGSEQNFAEIRQNFEELWTRLAKLNGLSCLIEVTHVFEDFGTSYAVYNHFNGISLREYLLRSKSGFLTWDKTRNLLMPLLSTLKTLHSCEIIHTGISPQTIFITSDGKLKLTGFLTQNIRTIRSKVTSQIIDGYAASEQYGYDGSIGPWTDVYGFSAVLYRALIGSDPISAKERITNDRLMVPGKFAETIPAYVINALINSMQILPRDRTQNIEQLRAELSASPSAANASTGNNSSAKTPKQIKKADVQKVVIRAKQETNKNNLKLMLITAGAITLIGIIIFGILSFTLFRDKFNFGSDDNASETIVLNGDKVQVPEFINRSYVDIETNAVFQRNFNFKVNYEYNEDVNEGYIISQSITAGTEVNSGTEITITVSKGNEKVMLQDVTGYYFESAEQILTEAGFIVIKKDADGDDYEENKVISMAPVANKAYAKGTTVYLRVYTPPTTIPVTEATTKEATIQTTTQQQTESVITTEATSVNNEEIY